MNVVTSKAKLTKARAPKKPSRADAESAVRTLLLWAGEDPDREGLKDTPGRVVRSYEEFFRGYAEDPVVNVARGHRPSIGDEGVDYRSSDSVGRAGDKRAR